MWCLTGHGRLENQTKGRVPERPKGADCKSVVNDFGGPNPPSPIIRKTSRFYDKLRVFFGFLIYNVPLIIPQFYLDLLGYNRGKRNIYLLNWLLKIMLSFQKKERTRRLALTFNYIYIFSILFTQTQE